MQSSTGDPSPPRHVGPRHRAAALATAPGLAATVVLAPAAVPGLVVLAHLALGGGPLAGLGLLVPGALLVGAERASRPPRGPAIHDRQLDRIVAALAGTAALAIALSAPDLGDPLLVLTVGCLAVAAMALTGGTRRFWQLRAAPVLLLAAWPTPWEVAARAVDTALGSGTAALAVPALVGAVVAALLLAPHVRRRPEVLPRGVEVPVSVPARPATAPPAVVELCERGPGDRVAS